MIKFKGYHGTSYEASESILNSNYIPSIGDEEWLGDGAYFFVEGISVEVVKLAEKWIIAQSMKKSSENKKYRVLESSIEVDDNCFLDLTTRDGVEILDYLTEKYIDKIKSIGKKLSAHDGLLINMARMEQILKIDVAKGNFYIQFKRERLNNIKLRTSNCTICSVFEPSKNIKKTIAVKTGNL